MNFFSVREYVKPEEVLQEDAVAIQPAAEQPYEDPLAMLAADIKVVGAGGGGSNAVNRMIESGLSGVQFIAVNTDAQDLTKSKAKIKLQIGTKLTGGRGAGGRPEIGEAAANEDYALISETLRGADMVFVTAGMGGGTGTGSAPIIAKIARDMGALTVGVITKPFGYEAARKMKIAEEGIKKLRDAVDTLIIIPNEHLFKIVDRKTSVSQAYRIADDVLRQGVQGISDLITKTGLINTDFADVEATMKSQGDALMGIGIGSGDNRAKEAAERAIDNPLLEDTTIDGATRLLVNIAGPEDIALVEIDEVMKAISTKADPGVETIHGVNFDPELGDDIKVTVIATGFKNTNADELAGGNPKKNESASENFINLERFNEMRGQSVRRASEGYSGILKPKEFCDNLDVPTVIRKHNFETCVQTEKAANDGRNA